MLTRPSIIVLLLNGPLPRDIREVLAAVYEHVLADGDWPLTQNLNIELRNRGLRLEALAAKQRGLISGVDAFQEGARTHLSLKGMVLVENAESDVAWIIKIVRKLGEHHATNPQRRDVPVLEVANEIGLSDHAVLARLVRVLGVQGSPFLVLGGPGYPVGKATFGTNAYFLDFREVETPLDLIRTVERAYDPGWDDEKAKADSEDDMLEQDEEDQSADSFSSEYVLVEKVNIGAFADVWRAKDPFGRTVAAKIVRSSMAEQSSALEHAKALARAEHPNVVRLYTIARIEDPETRSPVDAIIMEFLEGEDLEERFGRVFTRAEVRQYGQELIEGVEHIHAQHLAHGDLHEGNVMVTARGLKIIDILYMVSKSTQIDGKAGSGERGERWESREAIAECAHWAASARQSTRRQRWPGRLAG